MDATMITLAALDVLDEIGLEKLSMRAVATRLSVRAGGLYYYLPDKSALLRSMADEICRRVLVEFETADGGESAECLCACLRRVLNEHRDSVRVLAAGPLSGSVGALALMNRLLDLLKTDTLPALITIAGDTLMSYVTGFVLQEQIQVSTAAVPTASPHFQAQFPMVFSGIDVDDETMFSTAISTIVAGFAAAAK